jgi:hypothetical protein
MADLTYTELNRLNDDSHSQDTVFTNEEDLQRNPEPKVKLSPYSGFSIASVSAPMLVLGEA